MVDGAAGPGEAGGSGVTDEGMDGEEEDGEDVGGSAEGREVKWGLLPEGLHIASKPDALDASLIGRLIYMRWNAPHGWLLGTIKEKFDASTPRLYKKFNYRIKWFDGWENHKLILDNYVSGPARGCPVQRMGDPGEDPVGVRVRDPGTGAGGGAGERGRGNRRPGKANMKQMQVVPRRTLAGRYRFCTHQC